MTNTPIDRALSPFEQLMLRLLLSGPKSGLDLVRLCTHGHPDPHVVRATYLALHRLERRRLLACEWRSLPGRQIAIKRYCVTSAGFRNVTGSSGTEVQKAHLTAL